jgi:glutamate-1-semialdehyde 2,1-aminomutase
MIEKGVYLPPSQYEAAFVSAAHTEGDIEKTLFANREALEKITR